MYVRRSKNLLSVIVLVLSGTGECHLDENCLIKGVIYRAEITAENETFTYTGLMNRTLEERFYKYKRSFKEQTLKGPQQCQEKYGG